MKSFLLSTALSPSTRRKQERAPGSIPAGLCRQHASPLIWHILNADLWAWLAMASRLWIAFTYTGLVFEWQTIPAHPAWEFLILLLLSVNDSQGLQRNTFLTMWPTIRTAWTDALCLGVSRPCSSEVKHSPGRGRRQSGMWAQPVGTLPLCFCDFGGALPWARNANESQESTNV